MRKNNKGFTLVELLVAIVIMGIITALALPEVQQLQSKNREKKYEKYEESAASSAKLYVDSYEEDLFGTATTGCKDLDYDMLSSKNLLKDYETNDVTCEGTDTFVHIEKKDGKYVYQPYITCRKDGTIVYQTSTPVTKCDAIPEFNSQITGSISVNDATSWTKTKTATIAFSSTAEGGMQENCTGSYCVADSSGNCVTSWTPKIFSEMSGDTTKVTFEIDNSSLSGTFKLRFKPINIQDKYGETYTSDLYSDNFNLDNTAPVITNVIETTRSYFYIFSISALKIEYDNVNAGSSIESIVYSYDNFTTDSSLTCKVASKLGISEEFLKFFDIDLCSIDDEKKVFYISKSQLNESGIIYIKITDKAGNSSIYEYTMGTNVEEE